MGFRYLVGFLMLLLASCASRARIVGPAAVTTAAPEQIEAPPADNSDLFWRTIKGQKRTPAEVAEALRPIMSELGVTGLSIAVTYSAFILSDGAHTYTIHLGERDLETHEPVDIDTVFRVGRLGQSILAYLVLKLHDKGLFDADQPLWEALPKPLSEYPAYADLANSARWKRLTARLILMHRSGLVNLRSDRPDRKLAFARSPGGRFGYSEEGIRLLRFVLEEKFGQNIDEIAKPIVYDKLAMRRTGFIRRAGFEGHIATAGPAAATSSLQDPGPLNSIYISARDYNRYLWGVIMCGGAFSNPYIGRPLHDPQVPITSKTILGRPSSSLFSNAPLGFAWAFGLGRYYTGSCFPQFMGLHERDAECYATTVPDFSGRVTVITILAVGSLKGSIIGRALDEVIGPIEPPLAWLGF